MCRARLGHCSGQARAHWARAPRGARARASAIARELARVAVANELPQAAVGTDSHDPGWSASPRATRTRCTTGLDLH